MAKECTARAVGTRAGQSHPAPRCFKPPSPGRLDAHLPAFPRVPAASGHRLCTLTIWIKHGRWAARRGVVRADRDLARLIRRRMSEAGLSLRGLARAAEVSHSSVSRLLSGQTRPTPALLRALAPALGCPAAALLSAAGIAPPMDDPVEALRTLGVDPAPPELIAHVAERLERLREYAATDEALALARDGLERKLAALGARGPVVERLLALGQLYQQGGGAPREVRLVAGSAVLYFLLAVDAIDDFLFPVGYLDDALAVALAESDIRRRTRGPLAPS